LNILEKVSLSRIGCYSIKDVFEISHLVHTVDRWSPAV